MERNVQPNTQNPPASKEIRAEGEVLPAEHAAEIIRVLREAALADSQVPRIQHQPH